MTKKSYPQNYDQTLTLTAKKPQNDPRLNPEMDEEIKMQIEYPEPAQKNNQTGTSKYPIIVENKSPNTLRQDELEANQNKCSEQITTFQKAIEKVNEKISLNEDKMITFRAEMTAINDRLLLTVDQHAKAKQKKTIEEIQTKLGSTQVTNTTQQTDAKIIGTQNEIKQINNDMEFWTTIQSANVKSTTSAQSAIDNLETRLTSIHDSQADKLNQLQTTTQNIYIYGILDNHAILTCFQIILT